MVVRNHSHHSNLMPFCFIAVFLMVILRLWFMIKYPLLVEEAYYWNYAQHLDFSYLDHPPMVAWLIRLGTVLWGDNEWGVRFATLPCWLLTILFSYRLTESMQAGAGKYSVLFLSFLPFFFIYSTIITPDIPLILAWNATLFYLYEALILNKPSSWYFAGIWIGLGLLSKYTIALLGIATMIYLLIVPAMRHWFFRKQPYLAAAIAMLVFSPVLYWNATHEWASFLFQTHDRFHASYKITIHLFIGLILLFFTPMGIIECIRLLTSRQEKLTDTSILNPKPFIFYYTAIPLFFFAFFSLFHQIKFNWIGPSLLAMVPWFSMSVSSDITISGQSIRRLWQFSSITGFFIYCAFLFTLLSNRPMILNQEVTLVDWQDAARQIHQIAQTMSSKYQQPLTIIPLDRYNIASELIFYQHKFKTQNQAFDMYPVLSPHLFGFNSLMFQYWNRDMTIKGDYLLLVASKLLYFDLPALKQQIEPVSPILQIDQYNLAKIKTGYQFYYQIVKIKG